MDVIEFNKVSFHYQSSKEPIIDNISFSVAENDFVTVIGYNGSGKTTLIRLINGVLKPYKGSVKIGGEKNKGQISYVPQEYSVDKYFPISSIDVVLMGCLKHKKKSKKQMKAEALNSLASVGMDYAAYSNFSNLSGGERKRVIIARALVNNPDILLLDEPTANIDSTSEKQLLSLLKVLNERVTIIFVTHDLSLVPDIANKVICLGSHFHMHDVAGLSAEDIIAMLGKRGHIRD